MDITISCADVTISHSGESDVHLTGYRTIAIVGLEEDDDEFEGDEDGLGLYRTGGRRLSNDVDDGDEYEDSSDEEEAPRAVPLGKKKKKNNQLIENEASEGSSSDDEEEEEEVEEEEDDSSEEEEDDSEPEEEEEEEEEEAPPAKSTKRAAVAAQTPQPAKKAKAADVAKAPATAPAKVISPNGESPAGDHTEFAAELKSFLQKNGPCKLSVLGSSVKRPPKSPKFKKLIELNSDVFSFNPVTETVSLNPK